MWYNDCTKCTAVIALYWVDFVADVVLSVIKSTRIVGLTKDESRLSGRIICFLFSPLSHLCLVKSFFIFVRLACSQRKPSLKAFQKIPISFRYGDMAPAHLCSRVNDFEQKNVSPHFSVSSSLFCNLFTLCADVFWLSAVKSLKYSCKKQFEGRSVRESGKFLPSREHTSSCDEVSCLIWKCEMKRWKRKASRLMKGALRGGKKGFKRALVGRN